MVPCRLLVLHLLQCKASKTQRSVPYPATVSLAPQLWPRSRHKSHFSNFKFQTRCSLLISHLLQCNASKTQRPVPYLATVSPAPQLSAVVVWQSQITNFKLHKHDAHLYLLRCDLSQCHIQPLCHPLLSCLYWRCGIHQSQISQKYDAHSLSCTCCDAMQARPRGQCHIRPLCH